MTICQVNICYSFQLTRTENKCCQLAIFQQHIYQPAKYIWIVCCQLTQIPTGIVIKMFLAGNLLRYCNIPIGREWGTCQLLFYILIESQLMM